MPNFKYQLPESLIQKAASIKEFANGGTQVSLRLKDGRVFHEALISNATWIVAMRGYDDLPFQTNDIAEIFQKDADKNAKKRNGWKYWDDWK